MCRSQYVSDDASRLAVWHLIAAGLHSTSFLVLIILLTTGPSSSWPVTIPSYNGSRVNWSAWYVPCAPESVCVCERAFWCS